MTVPQAPSNPFKSNRWLLFIVVLFSLLTLTGVYALTQRQKQITPTLQLITTPAIRQPTPTTLLSQNYSREPTESATTAGWKTSKLANLQFKYPPTWEILTYTPEEFKYENGKMFYRDCTLYLQNSNVNSTIIAIELVGDAAGDFCWSRGSFQAYRTRQTNSGASPQYIEIMKWSSFTPGSGGADTLAWDGILFQSSSVESVVIALVYQEEDDKDESIYDQILSTFQFLDKNTDDQQDKLDLCIDEKNDLINLVKQFEDLQTNKDGLAVLSLFTPALTAEDIATYNHLSGKDTNTNPRLYSAGTTNFKLLSYTIVQQPEKTSTNSCNLLIQEERQYWRQGIGGWLYPVSITVHFEIVKQHKLWKIDKYQTTTDGNYQGKYSGW